MQSSSIRSMFLDLIQSLTYIDSKLTELTDRMDRLKEKVHGHGNGIEQLELRPLDLDDEQHTAGKKLLQMEKVL
ncbi:hypothetical protein NDU88_001695 [Pleurodeles waltl]|uniref:Uncharacterized protein n=1 Tax=Pleurodeles waltl TaxID=8319 RepID=A0AAV7WJ39_PLEWA|nr:hypothetical protein NDU88_001695 [Pleurodeles waltl]